MFIKEITFYPFNTYKLEDEQIENVIRPGNRNIQNK